MPKMFAYLHIFQIDINVPAVRSTYNALAHAYKNRINVFIDNNVSFMIHSLRSLPLYRL